MDGGDFMIIRWYKLTQMAPDLILTGVVFLHGKEDSWWIMFLIFSRRHWYLFWRGSEILRGQVLLNDDELNKARYRFVPLISLSNIGDRLIRQVIRSSLRHLGSLKLNSGLYLTWERNPTGGITICDRYSWTSLPSDIITLVQIVHYFSFVRSHTYVTSTRFVEKYIDIYNIK